MRIAKFLMSLAAVLLLGTTMAVAQSIAEAQRCVQVQNLPEQRSTSTKEHCVTTNENGNVCFDRLYSVQVTNSCNRQFRVYVNKGRWSSYSYIGAGKSQKFSCLQSADQCNGVSITFEETTTSSDKPPRPPGGTSDAADAADDPNQDKLLGTLLNKQQKKVESAADYQKRMKENEARYQKAQQEIADRKAREKAEEQAKLDQLERDKRLDAERRERIRREDEARSPPTPAFMPTPQVPMCSAMGIGGGRTYSECISTCNNNSCGQTTCRSECFDAAIRYNGRACRPSPCN